MRRRALLVLAVTALLLGLTVQPVKASVIEYDCNPSSTGWHLKGQWGDGTVMEERTCIRFDNIQHKVSSYSYWRTRKGGTPVLSDWNLTETQSWVHSWTTTNDYGLRSNFGDAFDTSFITISSYWGCSQVNGNHQYQAFLGAEGLTANPNGSLPVSGRKTGESYVATDSFINC